MSCGTDIPAFYSRWFLNRIKAGFVLVRNQFNPQQVTRYRLLIFYDKEFTSVKITPEELEKASGAAGWCNVCKGWEKEE
ncbi:MAG: DUF1848 family protein [Lachnospiraceae bacterium]|uniref:DUF1848 domain-containing protein n=1 Tax=Candidatus Weimeria bifida TaxID=2599074 RepID=A0A6N7IY80_9FIRM|nr:DUF1848 domain-containing protein [Candidatus Weimeria bifida]RRF95797.1 MAG: DUF1848 family protein [Lachnospiraceae bacterium]